MERGGYRNRGGGGGGGGGREGGGGSGRGRGFYRQPQSGGGSGRGRGSSSQSQQQWQQRPNPSSSSTQTYSDSGSSSNPPQPSKSKHLPPQIHQPDIGVLQISDSEQAVGKITPVHRPDKGGTLAIRYCNLRVNHFPVTFNPQSIIMHYNVDVKAKLPPKKGQHPKKILKSELSMIRDKLFSDHPQRLPSLMTAYDGEKNIFSAVPLPEETFSVDVSKGEDERPISYNVTLTLVNKLELRKLKDYLSSNVLSIPRDILQGMDLVVKENPARRTISVGRSFYPTNPPLVERDLQHGIIAIGGFQHSLKTTSQGLSLCLDYSVLSFRKKMSVLDFLHEHIENFNLAEFRKYKKYVEQALIGLKVNVTHRRTKQKYTIARLTSKDTQHIDFTIVDPQGQNPPKNISLLAYFKDKYNVNIQYKDIPALDFGGNKTNYVPMELCILVEGQRYPKEHLDYHASKTLKGMSLPHPREREAVIQTMVKSSDGPCGGGILQNFGMSVNTSMTNLKGRVMGPPVLKLGDRNGKIISMTLDPEKCQWNLVGKSMVEGKPVECWGILDFTSNGHNWRKLKGKQFVQNLIDKYRKLGIYMKEPVWYESSEMWKLGNYNLLCELLEKINDRVQKKCQRRLQFLLCVMADKDQGYKWLKWISETRVGIVTQCCLSGNANEGKDQYLTNLALKINAKIGGSNVELNNTLPHLKGEGHVMFIGADVNHPGSQDTNSPSIAAVVATVNWPAANRYAARVCAQDRRTEKILNFGEVCLELVAYYDRLNKVRPEKIVIFRDGVSESQFDMVLSEELQDLKTKFHRSNYFPTITLIVAQKRHQTRLFPAGAREGTSSGNVFPGTVVDTKVVHPFEFDFYLCSHYGSLGTSKPTHYHVLWDEHKFTSNDLQKLIYDMCFTYARCTKPVSLVPPVYYADLAAYRGRLYYEAGIGVQSPNSAASSSSSSSPMASSSLSSTTSQSNDPGCYKLHADVENAMFFI
ncbi:protein argonaute 2-like [Gastrolobium bilobum]|uniref:protein argonaute 2-like n=1 Tax=Gastrolobium bilobum TaxID=150636 RepID=UPI002AB29EA0|nr:protein argonaute 2-like [Gastrolobium bilobum]